MILDSEGAQNLLGQGDMLFSLGGGGSVLRLHAPWASEDEIESIVGFIRDQERCSMILASWLILSGGYKER